MDGAEIERILQSQGVAAHRVQNSSEAFRDPQFVHRGHFVDLHHPTLGSFTVEGPRAIFSRARRRGQFAGLLLVLVKTINMSFPRFWGTMRIKSASSYPREH